MESKPMQDIFALQKTIAAARAKAEAEEAQRRLAEESKAKLENVVIEDVETIDTNLPTTYVSAVDLKLSAKELTKKTSYLDRLKDEDERYEKLKITEAKAKKIRRSLTRLTTGSASVVPLRCKGSECSFKTTCVTGDTKVLMRGGSLRSIKNISIGESIYSFNTETKELEHDKVINSVLVGTKEVYEIITKSGNTITATSDHPFYTKAGKDFKWLSIDEGLNEGSAVVVVDFEDYQEDLISVGDCYLDYIYKVILKDVQPVYDITVKKNQNFVANNFVVHNCPYYLEGVAPVGLACQPTGSKVLTTSGYKNIENLDPDTDLIVNVDKVGTINTIGSSFRKASRYYNGNLYEFVTEKGSYSCTHDHKVIVSINEEKLLQEETLWLLDTEEGFKIKRGTPFYSVEAYLESNYATDGWLLALGPTVSLVEKYSDTVLQTEGVEALKEDVMYHKNELSSFLEMEARFVIKGVMDLFINRKGTLVRFNIEEIVLKPYVGLVHSLEVHDYPNYFTDSGILTHNCLVETQLIEYWLEKYQVEFNVSDDSITDMHMIARLCEYDIYDMRVTRYLAEEDQTLLSDFISSYDENNNPITNKATSVAFDVKERIDKLRSKTLKELMATRESKAKVLTAVNNSIQGVALADMKQKYDDLVRERSKVVN